MSRYRHEPIREQEQVLLRHCSDARYVWNLAVEQHSWWRPGRKAGRHEGFRVTGQRGKHWDVRRLNRKRAEVKIPKVGWVRFRLSRPLPPDVKSFRVTLDRAGRWHVAFAAIPTPIPAPGTGEVVGIDRGVKVSTALSTGEMLTVPNLADQEAARLLRLERKLARARRGSACGHVDARSRESQADFVCTACGYVCNADVNAARNIAAGHAVNARGGDRVAGPVNREPQLALLAL